MRRRRSPPITETRADAIEQTLRLLGYAGQWHSVTGRPTLAAYLKNRTGIQRSHPCVVFLTTHCVAVSGGVFCDPTNNGVMIDIEVAPGRRKRITRVFVVTHRIAPTHIPSKASSSNQPAHGEPQGKRRRNELDRLFREAIKAETGATRIKVTSTDVFIIRPDDSGWHRIVARDVVKDRLLKLQDDGCIRGNTDEAAAYRAAIGF